MTPKKRMPPRCEPGPVSLLERILADRPNLPAAACRGKHELFDAALHPGHNADSASARAEATVLCRHCPARPACPDNLTTH